MTRKENRQEDKNQKGSFEISLGDLFKCSCCIHTGMSYEEKRLCEIDQSLQQINKRLELLDRFEEVIVTISRLKLFVCSNFVKMYKKNIFLLISSFITIVQLYSYK